MKSTDSQGHKVKVQGLEVQVIDKFVFLLDIY